MLNFGLLGPLAQFDITGLSWYIAKAIYGVLLLIALWGAFCTVIVWMRIAQKRFRDEVEQDAFLDDLEKMVVSKDFESAEQNLDGDLRAMPQLALLALHNRESGYTRVRHLVMDRFQRDVLADLQHRLSWVHTVIKAAQMVGLLGTVMGMMAAFAKLAAPGTESVDPKALANDISFALITTACGLAIAIPLVLCVNSINVRISKMEDLVAVGLSRFFDVLRLALGKGSATGD